MISHFGMVFWYQKFSEATKQPTQKIFWKIKSFPHFVVIPLLCFTKIFALHSYTAPETSRSTKRAPLLIFRYCDIGTQKVSQFFRLNHPVVYRGFRTGQI